MRLIILIILILGCSVQAFSQSNITKKELKKIFGEKQEILGAYTWNTSNENGALYLNDTIKLYYKNNLSCFEIEPSSEWISWTFLNPNKLHMKKVSSCDNPPRSFYGNGKNFYKVKYKIVGENLLLTLKNKHDSMEMNFKVINLVKCEGDWVEITGSGYCLILTRIQQNNAP